MPTAGVVSDGQHSVRKAVAKALPGVPHQLCQSHYLREAARPPCEADRNAKTELKERVRGVRGPLSGNRKGARTPRRGWSAATATPSAAPGPMTGGRPWGLPGWSRTTASAASRRARSGSPKKGAPQGTATTEGATPRRPGGDGGAVAGAAVGVRPGVEGGPHPRGGRGLDVGPGAAATGRPSGGDETRRRRGGVPGAGGAALPQGDAEPLAGAVLLLRRGRLAARQQRPGTVLRGAPVSRETLQRSQGRGALPGVTRRGTPVSGGGVPRRRSWRGPIPGDGTSRGSRWRRGGSGGSNAVGSAAIPRLTSEIGRKN